MLTSKLILSTSIFYDGLQVFLLLFFFFLCFLPILVAFRRDSFDLFEPIVIYVLFSAMSGIVIVDRVYLQGGYIRHQNIIQMQPSAALLLVTVLYTLFLSGVLVGYYLDITRWFEIPQMSVPDSRYNTRLLKRISYGYMAMGLGFYLLALLIALDGNPFRLFTSTEPRSEIFEGLGILILGTNLLPLGYLIWLAALVSRAQRFNVGWLLLMVPITFMLFLFGGRGNALSIMVSVTIFLYYSMLLGVQDIEMGRLTLSKDRLHYYFKMSIVPVIGFFLGIIVIGTGALRQGRDIGKEIESIDVIRILTAGVHNNILDRLLVTIEMVPDEFGYYWGTHIFRVPLNWIPRALWSDKPVLSAGSLLRNQAWPERSGGTPPGEIGRFYLDLGIPGILIGALLSGIALRFAYELLKKNSSSPIFLVIYSWIIFSIARSPLVNASVWNLMTTIVFLLPLLLSKTLSRDLSRSDA